MVTDEQLKKIDKPDTVLDTMDPITGEVGYRVGIEVFHQVHKPAKHTFATRLTFTQLHCLNLLRKVTYKEYYEALGGDVSEAPKTFRGHLGKFPRCIFFALAGS